jgi:cell division protein FtsB
MAFELIPESLTGALPIRQKLSVIQGERRSTPATVAKKNHFTAILIGAVIFNLLLLLLINTLMTKDAFVLERLKQQSANIQDERDALLREVSALNSPDHLSATAQKLGMVPVGNITYLTLDNSGDRSVKR